MQTSSATDARSASGLVLATLAAGQFVMVLDSTVMNVSIVNVAHDVHTDVTGIQTAITMYTLVMATMMITGGKIGRMIGPKRAYITGCIVYATGSFTTALAHSLPVLLLGWSLFEGLGAALIMPALVALVASNFGPTERPKAYGMLAAAAAGAIAIGPLIGGSFTTYLSWRWVFVGEVIAVALIMLPARRMRSAPPDPAVRLDVVGAIMSAIGLGTFVFGLLRSGTWGFLHPKPGAPVWFGLSPSFWMLIGGIAVMWLFLLYESHIQARGKEPLLDPALLRNLQLRSGLLSFMFQSLQQGGFFFLIALYLTVALGLDAMATGVRLLPVSIALLLTATLVPRRLPHASPRRIVRTGFLLILSGLLLLIVLLQHGTGASVVTWPLILMGTGMGCLASQLGAVVVGSVPDERSGEVGGLQNTATNLGASIATALAGAVLISALTTTFLANLRDNPAVPPAVVQSAEVNLSAGVPFVSDAQLTNALQKAQVPADVADAIVKENTDARIAALRATLALLALLGTMALLVSSKIPQVAAIDRE